MLIELFKRNSMQKFIFILLAGLAPYWFMNATVWIPWVFLSRTIGIAIMIIFVPLFWGYAAYYSFRYLPVERWKSDRIFISLVFLISSLISDVFFFLFWRHLSLEELYHPSTIGSYIMVLVVPFFAEKIAEKNYKKGKFKVFTSYRWLILILFTAISFAVTLYCVRFW